LERLMTEPIISIRDLSVAYDGHQVLDHVNLDIQRNEILVLLGGSGSGKSTTLRHIIGLERPDSGSILVRGVDINRCSAIELREIRRSVGVALQDAALVNSLSTEDNVGLPMRN
jgi:phospholipid/cholesterol/gamma-HCH transport system ATP-binding protein